MTTVESRASLNQTRFAVVTTFRRDGTPVPTPMELLLEGGRVYFVTNADTGKVRRLRRDTRVRIAPVTLWSRAQGPVLTGQARLLEGAEAARVDTAFRRRRFWGWLAMAARAVVKRTGRIYIEVVLES